VEGNDAQRREREQNSPSHGVSPRRPRSIGAAALPTSLSPPRESEPERPGNLI
jgi:hypothetical protein